jgi:hypothetical protein
VDQLGADAALGIEQFKSTSGLNVHYAGLTLNEVGSTQVALPALYRAMNFNYSNGPHEGQYQHAVVLDWGTMPRSATVTTDAYVCQDGGHVCQALPKDVDHIGINPDFINLTNLDVATTLQFVSEIVHELAHSVDVYHHGDVATSLRLWILDNSKPPNVTECEPLVLGSDVTCKPGTEVPITVITEDQDPSSPNAVRLGFQGQPRSKPLPVWRLGNAVCGSANTVTWHGLHSGDQSSAMRYYDAAFYIPQGFPNVRISIGPEEAATPGILLTNSPTGTGVNDPARQPRPRYGDAFGGNNTPDTERGNDLQQIDVNDAHTEIVRPRQDVCSSQ